MSRRQFRYRTNWRGLLILQIGEMYADYDGFGGEGPSYMRWRDAKLEDVPSVVCVPTIVTTIAEDVNGSTQSDHRDQS